MATLVLYCFLYAGGIAFLAGCVVRAVRYAKEPIHLRWEIYPVPHGRSGELKIMVPEILFLKGLWEFNRPMWLVSYPFHLGLYLIIITLAGVVIVPGGGDEFLHRAALITGNAGLVLVLAGATGLLVRRLTNRELRIYSSGADIFNLLFFLLTAVLLLAGYWLRPAGTPGPLAVLRGVLAWDGALRPSGLLTAGLVSGAALAAYIPMTHMAHFIAKYFTYHSVRWDERSAEGSIARRMAEYLTYRPTWAAKHVSADGQRTWAEIATTNPARGGSK